MAYKSETEQAAELQEKAITIRDYMQEPDTMRQIVAALPQWLRADNFIRLFYTAMMKTPKLMLCSKQSLLSSMIEAAQIGLVPVLGKAALIPYKNEVQFQPMYKGLIEVARRFAQITITAHVVYEVDEFDMTWGDDEKIDHTPDFKNPDREKSAKIGAYDVWKGGDKEIISRRFMTTGQIIHIRNTYSKTWESKGEKSVWGLHEDEMFIKTVIKNHTKLEPQCIEMERAALLDDHAEIGRSQLGMGSIHGLPMPSAFDLVPEAPEEPEGKGPGPGPGPEKAPADLAKTMSAQSGIPVKDIAEFVLFIAKKQEKPVAWVEENALKSPESFIKAVRNRLETLKAEAEKAKGKGKPEAGGTDAAHMKEFWNLRIGKGGKTGLKAFVSQHINRIYDVYSEIVRSKIIEKFNGFYPGETFPPRFKKPEVTPDTAHNGSIGGADGQPPFKNRFEQEAEQEAAAKEGIEKGLSPSEEVGANIRKAKEVETAMLARYDNSVESVMKFDKSGFDFTIEDFENYMKEMAHMEGVTFLSFKADVMKNHQFPDYFDKFIAKLSGAEV